MGLQYEQLQADDGWLAACLLVLAAPGIARGLVN